MKKNQEKKEQIKKFRLKGKHLFLTYAQIKMEREEVLKVLRRKLEPRKIEKYVIATEEHKTGEEHVHVYVRLDRECDIQAARRLDLGEEGGEVHGNYQSCRS
jgi:hypothetical protein